MQTRFRQSGFTLLELVLVLMIIGTLSAMAAPGFTGSRSSLIAQSAQYATEIRHVQAMAMNQGRTLVLEIQSATRFRVTSAGAIVTDPATQRPYTITLENDVSVIGTSIGFDNMGRPLAANTLLQTERLFTFSDASRTAVVSVSPVTGFVAVQP